MKPTTVTVHEAVVGPNPEQVEQWQIVYESGNRTYLKTADGRRKVISLGELSTEKHYRGTVFIHPGNKVAKVFGFYHPIFVRPGVRPNSWDWSHNITKQHTVMVWPSAVLVAK